VIWIIKKLYKSLDNNSWQGLLERTKKRGERMRWRWLYYLDKKFIGLGAMLKKWVMLEKKIDEVGLPAVSRELLEELGIRIEIDRPVDKWTDGKRGVIFLGLNHESIIEPILAFSIMGRRDVNLISGQTFTRLGRNFAKSVLPVMQRKYAWNFQKKSIVAIHGMLYRAENLSLEDVDRINRSTFDKTAEKLKNKEAVILFTMGGHKMDGKWGRGIEEMIRRIEPEKRKEIDMVPLYFSGLRRLKLFWRMRRAAMGKKSKEWKIKVKIGEILNMGEVVRDEKRLTDGAFVNWLREKYLIDFGYLRPSRVTTR